MELRGNRKVLVQKALILSWFLSNTIFSFGSLTEERSLILKEFEKIPKPGVSIRVY